MLRKPRFTLWQLIILVGVVGVVCTVSEPYYSGWKRHERLTNFWRERGASVVETGVPRRPWSPAPARSYAEIGGTGLCSESEFADLLADPYVIGLSTGVDSWPQGGLPATRVDAPLRKLTVSWSPVSAEQFLDLAAKCDLEQAWLLFNQPPWQPPTERPPSAWPIPRALQTLSLAWSHVTEREFKQMGECLSIRNLDLTCVPITDEQLKLLGKLSLEELVLASTNVTGEGLEALAQPQCLRRLSLSQGPCAIGNDYVDPFQYLDVHEPPTDSTAERTLRHLSRFANLEALDLSYSNFDLNEWTHVAQLDKLEWLCLTQTSVGNAQIASLRCLDSIDSLGLAHTEVDDAVLDTLTQCTRLRVLDIRDTRMTMAGVEELLQTVKLEVLITSWSPAEAYHLIYEADQAGVSVLSFQDVLTTHVPWKQAAKHARIDTAGEYGEMYPFRSCVVMMSAIEEGGAPWDWKSCGRTDEQQNDPGQ